MTTLPPLLALLDPEPRLLLLTAGGAELDPLIRETVSQPIDWTVLRWMSEYERATGPLWRRLQSVVGADLPQSARAEVEPLALIADFQSAYLRDRLLETLGCLTDAGIEVILLKGAAIGFTAYESFLDRPMGDLDLLVPAERSREAHELARAAGWTWDAELYPFDRYTAHHHLPPLSDSRNPQACLELHTSLFMSGNPYALGPAELRSSARPVHGLPALVYVPSPEYELLHLTTHFAWSHMLRFGAWRMIRDLRALIESGMLDWAAFVRLATTHRAQTSCYWTFRLAARLAGVEVPAEVVQQLSPPQPRWVIAALERHLVNHVLPTIAVCPSEAVRRGAWSWALLPGRSGHGSARPWQSGDPLRALRPAPERVWRKVRRLSQLTAWMQYLRAMTLTR